MTGSSAIELQQLACIYQAGGLAPVSLSIPQGEWVTILGPSGSGKTTFLKLIAGLVNKTGGNMMIPYSPREMSFVFQDSALLPWKTVGENIILPLSLRGVPRDQALQKAEPWLQKLKLNRFAQHYPHELSGGLKMRTSLARALITEPRLLLLDEPFAALDEPIRIELGLELRELWKSLRPTVLLVTHSLTEGIWLADRILVLQDQPGKLALDLKTGFNEKRTLALRGEARFLQQVEHCFELLRSPS